MKKIRWPIWLKLMFLLLFVPVNASYAVTGPEEPADDRSVVGRLSFVEGDVDRYVLDEDAWDPVVKDEPFGMDDVLESGRDGRAEAILPNNTWIRIGADTRIQLSVLEPRVTTVDVDSGVARFSNRGTDTVLKVTTPFGHVIAERGASFDLYVHLASIQVIAQRGTVVFVHNLDESRFEVTAGSNSLFANARRVEVREDYGDPEWEAWNRARDRLWSERMARRGPSVDYLPPSLYHEAYVLDAYGRWTSIYYDGAYRYFWRPIHVGFRWAPFTVGRWSTWHRGRNWLPEEAFGYVTHHYGNWIMLRGLWYWAPPVSRIRVRSGPSLLNIAFTWSPGRVGWIDYGPRIGWFVLAPHEHYRWRPNKDRRRIIAGQSAGSRIVLRQKRYRYSNHAVIAEKKKLSRGRGDYRRFKTSDRRVALTRKHISPPRIVNRRTSIHRKEKGRVRFRKNPTPDETRLTNRSKKRHPTALKIDRNDALDRVQRKGNKSGNKMVSLKKFGRKSYDARFNKAQLKRKESTRSKGVRVRDRSKPGTARATYLKTKSVFSKSREVRTARKAHPKIMKNRFKPLIRKNVTARRRPDYFKQAKQYRAKKQMGSKAFFSRGSMKNTYRRFNNRIAEIGRRNR